MVSPNFHGQTCVIGRGGTYSDFSSYHFCSEVLIINEEIEEFELSLLISLSCVLVLLSYQFIRGISLLSRQDIINSGFMALLRIDVILTTNCLTKISWLPTDLTQALANSSTLTLSRYALTPSTKFKAQREKSIRCNSLRWRVAFV